MKPEKAESSSSDGPANSRIDFSAALHQRWLEVWYQPKVELRSMSVCGAEALIRTRDPDRGIVEPVDFLPPAADPLYKPLSVFVAQQALRGWNEIADAGYPESIVTVRTAWAPW